MSVATIVVVIIIMLCVVSSLALRSGYIAWDRDKVGLPRFLSQTEVRLDELPDLAEALSRGLAPERYAALVFATPDRPSDEDAINIQMSVEDGKLGFDWVLLAPRNVKDREKFMAFAHAYGARPVARTMNGVSYLRVEDTDVVVFTTNVATEMYHLPPNASVGLVHEGFEWKGS